VNRSSPLLLWLRRERKWIIWVALLFVVLAAVSISITLLAPHHAVNTLLQDGERANGRETTAP